MKRLIIILSLLLLVGCQGVDEESADGMTNSVNNSPAVEEATQKDQPTIVLDGVEVTTGEEMTNDYFTKSSYTLVNVWGTFCQPCIKEMPELNDIHTMDRDIQVLGIVADLSSGGDNNFGPAQTIIDKTGVEYGNLVPTTEFHDQYLSSIQGLPTSFIVDREGKVISKLFVGAGSAEEYLEFIDYTLENLD